MSATLASTIVLPGGRGAAGAAATPRPSSVRDVWTLLKPNVMQLVVFTGWVGMYLAPARLHPVLGLVAVLAIAAAAGAALASPAE